MDVKDYCTTMHSELTGWKAKMYDIVRKMDNMPAGEKEKAAPRVAELHGIIDDITERIAILKTECPTDWEPERKAIESRVNQLKSKWYEVWDEYGIAEY
jgi:predicted nuclease with TOPRIM domain